MNKKINIFLYSLAGLLVAGSIVVSVLITRNVEKKQVTAPASSGDSSGSVVGKPAPDFSLPDINGKTVKLSDLKGKNIVLFFNEGQMCYPACWNQIEDLGDDPRFDTTNTVAYSIVVDSPEQW